MMDAQIFDLMTHCFFSIVCRPSWWPEAGQLLAELCLSSSVALRRLSYSPEWGGLGFVQGNDGIWFAIWPPCLRRPCDLMHSQFSWSHTLTPKIIRILTVFKQNKTAAGIVEEL